ncbi:winged helix-turn-helix domain-containing protein [Actinoplanes sp. TRM 88003]|uniref:Winged helix-turn-helix domain-containing protein n=1 Tax=Paractinoplanes aksuensis TaxID=2939490 RepID=A0ABT1DSC8_9ACTN|nr:BTAD domain-containing putative transcriptional regulator [Actinoplanes aksuensis]MCO8273727.1 winged helix-turn-helix domain-containing protein [Actinoplanes aksuensis]
MRFRILDGFEVEHDGQVVGLGPGKPKLLLAVLVSRLNESVTVPELVDALWGEQPPASAVENLRSYVHRLRRQLGHDTLVREGVTYCLVAEPSTVDARQFEAGIAAADDAVGRGELEEARDRFRTALSGWKSRPFGALAEERALTAYVMRLEEFRLSALERSFEVELDLGAGAGITVELTVLTSENPYRERLHGQLMRALSGAGRKADALKVYRDLRETLVADLGIEPGGALTELQQAILRDQPAPARPPAELPPATSYFTGRSADLKRLDELAESGLVAVVGPPGVGKTALVVQWAHDAAAGFPDGSLFIDLHGFHRQRPMPTAEAVGHLLISLGVEARAVPARHEDAVALYRSMVSGRRLLVVLDNARSAEQVRDLLPGSPAAVAVVTSRNRLTGLVAGHGARSLTVPPLPPADAVELLGRFLDDTRVGAQPGAATDLVEACDRLPLAVCIAAANLAEDPRRDIATHLSDLRLDRFAALAVDGERDLRVAATFDLSYESLDQAEQRTFRILGVLPCHDFTPESVAAATAGTVDSARRRLRRLARAHLVEPRGADRYAPHDLLREYARGRAEPAEAEEATSLLYEYYLRRCDSAARAMYPQMIRLPYPEDRPRDAEPAAVPDLVEWLNAELANLVAVGLQPGSWHLADLLRGWFWGRGFGDQWLAVATAAATADDVRARTMAALSLGNYYQRRHDAPAAHAQYAETLRLSRDASWPEAEAVAESAIGSLAFIQGDFETAVDHLENSLDVTRRSGGRPAGDAYNLLAGAQFSLGRLAAAREYLLMNLTLAQQDGARTAEALTRGNLAMVLCQQGDAEGAVAEATESLRLARELDEPMLDTVARVSLATAAVDPQQARQHAEHAAEVSSTVGDVGGECQARNALAPAYLALGRTHDAISQYSAALRLAAQASDVYVEIDATTGLATAYLSQGDLPQAATTIERAVARARTAGYRVLLARALTVQSTINRRQNRSPEADAALQEAHQLRDETGCVLPSVVAAGGL